jgi:hypothetical protein
MVNWTAISSQSLRSQLGEKRLIGAGGLFNYIERIRWKEYNFKKLEGYFIKNLLSWRDLLN